jgi:hypothetical protein
MKASKKAAEGSRELRWKGNWMRVAQKALGQPALLQSPILKSVHERCQGRPNQCREEDRGAHPWKVQRAAEPVHQGKKGKQAEWVAKSQATKLQSAHRRTVPKAARSSQAKKRWKMGGVGGRANRQHYNRHSMEQGKR